MTTRANAAASATGIRLRLVSAETGSFFGFFGFFGPD
jgi:hypothetical protein